jgi:5'-nucleotidase
MKARFLPSLTLLLALVLIGPSRAAADTLTIYHINDTHSALAPTGPRDDALRGTLGGIARAASVISAAKAGGGAVLALHAGDAFIGDLFFNRYFAVPELRLLAALGFDAMTLGNHELDLTPSTLEMALDSGFIGGGFPVLSANLVFPDTGFVDLRSYVAPYTIRQAGSIRVGIFGLTTPDANTLSQPAPLLLDDNVTAIASAMIDTLRARDCDVVVLLSHLGVHADEALAASISGIDVIVGGHDHYLYQTPIPVATPAGGTTLVLQGGAFYRDIGRLRLDVDDAGVHMVDYAMIPLDESVPEQPEVKGLIDGLVGGIEEVWGPVFSQRITYCEEDFEEVAPALMEPGFKDTPIGNLVTDAFRAATGTTLAIEPSGSTADKLFRGPITPEDAFRVVGYGYNTVNGLGFRIVTMSVPGISILGGLEFGLSQLEIGDDYLLQVSGMSYRYDPSRPVGSRLVDAKVGSEPLDPSAMYTLTTNEFVLGFFSVLGLPVSDVRIIEDTTEFQVLSGYLATIDTLSPLRTFAASGRIEAIVGPVSVDVAADAAGIAIDCAPDPMGDDGALRLTLPRAAHVKVTLHDALGRTVARLADERMPAGARTIVVDASGLATGTYVCTVAADGAIASRIVHVVH